MNEDKTVTQEKILTVAELRRCLNEVTGDKVVVLRTAGYPYPMETFRTCYDDDDKHMFVLEL